MPEKLLENLHRSAHSKPSPVPTINFSWHGGEPTLLGVDYFRKIVALQRRHQPPGRHITNGIQTNGTLLDENWCRFLADEGFGVGISMDGPQDLHDRYRLTKHQEPTHEPVLRGYHLLQKYAIPIDILCVVHSHNVLFPCTGLRILQADRSAIPDFFALGPAAFRRHAQACPADIRSGLTDWGTFLCNIFDAWVAQDIGKIKIQIFEEAAGTAFDQEHALCIFRKTCGDIPVLEHNGDVYSCDHFVTPEHRLGNIQETPLVELLESPAQKAFGQLKSNTLPRYCLSLRGSGDVQWGLPQRSLSCRHPITKPVSTICVRAINASLSTAGRSLKNCLALARTRNLPPQSRALTVQDDQRNPQNRSQCALSVRQWTKV